MKPTLFALATLAMSMPCFADFDYVGKGTTANSAGQQTPFTFGFAWDSEQGTLRIGNKSYDMDTLPESYSLALVLSKDDSQVWLQEFHSGWFDSFYWQLGEHVIRLEKGQFEQQVKGNYELHIDDRSYFFTSNNAAIKVNFAAEGVESITVSGVTKNMGTKN